MRVKKKILLPLIFLQLLIIVVLSYQSINKESKKISVSEVNTTGVINLSKGLKYFIEPVVGTPKPSWLSWEFIETINKDNLKDRYDYKMEKDKDTIRIITLGDSFTYGLNISTKDIWPEKLEDMLNNNCGGRKYEVINLGMRGYDIQYSLERFTIRGQKYNPDFVIWMILDNDFDYIEEEVAKLMEKNKKIMAEEGKTESKVREDGTFYNYWYELYGRSINELKKSRSSEDTLSFQMDKLNEFRQYYSNTIVLFGLKHVMDSESNISEIRSFVDKNDNTYFYLSKDEEWFKNLLQDGHPDIKGHKIISGDIFEYLTTNRIIPC